MRGCASAPPPSPLPRLCLFRSLSRCPAGEVEFFFKFHFPFFSLNSYVAEYASSVRPPGRVFLGTSIPSETYLRWLPKQQCLLFPGRAEAAGVRLLSPVRPQQLETSPGCDALPPSLCSPPLPHAL